MKKVLLVSAILALCGVAGLSQPVQALLGDDNEAKTVESTKQSKVLTSRTEVETTRQQDLEDKRTELRERVAEKRAAITEKLEGKRAERCEKKQTSINDLLDKRVGAAKRHLEKFKAIQTKLEDFVTKKNLSVENATALQVIMNEKQAGAQAAIDDVSEVNFECRAADAASPGGIVREQVTTAKQALKDYRIAIKNYAIAVKSAAAPATENDDTSGEATQ